MRSKIGKAHPSPPRAARTWRPCAAAFLCAAILLNVQWATPPKFAASTRGNDWTSIETIGEDPRDLHMIRFLSLPPLSTRVEILVSTTSERRLPAPPRMPTVDIVKLIDPRDRAAIGRAFVHGYPDEWVVPLEEMSDVDLDVAFGLERRGTIYLSATGAIGHYDATEPLRRASLPAAVQDGHERYDNLAFEAPLGCTPVNLIEPVRGSHVRQRLAAMREGLPFQYLRFDYQLRTRSKAAHACGLPLASISHFAFYASTKGSLTNIHWDADDAILHQLVGRKRVRLVSSEHTSLLQPTSMPVNGSCGRRSPLYSSRIPDGVLARVPHDDFVLEAGHALHIPAGMWHEIETLDTYAEGSVLRFQPTPSFTALRHGRGAAR